MPHVSVRLVASDKCDCLLPVSLLRELSLQDFAVFLFTDPVTGRSVIVSWSGGIARDKSCIELPRQYTSLNLVGQSYVNSENPQVFSLEMHRIDNLFHSKEITMEPVNDIDWHTICSHRAFLESNILRQLSVVYCSQMVCVRVTSSQSVNLRVISISSGNNLLNADDVSDGEATGSSGDVPELAGNLASGQLNDSDGTSLWSKVYEIMHSAYSSAKELISEDKESLTSVVLSTATSVGKLSSQSVVSIRPPCGRPTTSSSQDALDVNSAAPNHNHGAASEEMWQSELYRERICDSSSKQLLRVLPVWSRGKDSSYFGTDIVRKQLVDENEGVDCTADALSEGMRTLLSESTSEDDEILTAPEDICTCYVHPLYLLECEEMAFTYMVYTHQLEQRSNWNTGFLDKHWECMAIGGEGWCFLGTLQCTTDAMSIADCLQPVGLVGAPPRSDSSTPDIRPLISSVVVRVVPCARVRPGHILVSTDLRRALNLSDMELARLTLLDPLKHPPVRPAAVTVRCVEWNVLGEERNISVDIKSSLDVDSSTVCRRFKDKMISLRDCCRPLGPVFLPAELLITLPSQSHLPNSNLTLLVSFQKTTSGVPERYVGVLCSYYVVSCECSASEVARPHMYTLLDSDSEFIAFVDECCESITLALEGLREGTEGKASSPHSNWLLTANVLSDTYHRWHTTNATTGSALLPLPSEPVSIPLTEMRGCDEAIDDLLSDTMISFLPQAVFQRIVSPSQMGAIRSPVGSIIVGPPGCGKTTLSRGLCNHFASSLRTLVHVVTVRSDNVHTMKTERVCDMLSAAFDEAYSRAPSIVCIDDLHKICPSTYETSDSPLDSSMRARYEKISDHMTQLIKNTRHNNDFGTSQAERFYAILAQSPPVCDCVHEEASSKCNLEGQMFHSDLFRSIASEQTACEMPCKYGICSGGRGLAYAAHRIVASTVYKSVYVVATAPRTDEVNARLLTLLSIGRKIVPLTTTLLVDSQIEILCYALEKLGLPLFLASEAEDKASRRRELSLLGRIMEGYRPGDIWGLARRVVTLAHRRPFTVHQHGREMPTPLPTKNSVSVGEIEHASKMFLATAAKDLEVGTYDRSIMFNMIGGYENAKKFCWIHFSDP